MGIKHENCDVGAECDQFRESIDAFESKTTKDEHNDETNITTIEYINGEGDPPFIKYRMTVEPIDVLTREQYENTDRAAKAA